MHGRYHLTRSPILPGPIIGCWPSAPFAHPCRLAVQGHPSIRSAFIPLRIHPHPHCLQPSSSSSTSSVNLVRRSHQASIDSSTSHLTDLFNNHLHFLPYQSRLSFFFPFISSSAPLNISQFTTRSANLLTTHKATHISRQLQSFSAASVLQSFSPPHQCLRTCKNSNPPPIFCSLACIAEHQQGPITSHKSRLAFICLSPQSQHQISGGILPTDPLHDTSPPDYSQQHTRFHSFPAVS